MRESKPLMTPAPARGDRYAPSIEANVPSPPEKSGFRGDVIDGIRAAHARRRG